MHYEVALRGEYEEFETVLWLRESIRPGDCILDIGANVGQMTLEAAELCGPSGKVISVEPAIGNIAILQRHIDANHFRGRVEIICAACGADHCSEASFDIVGDHESTVGSGHTLSKFGHSTEAVHRITVPMISIDGLVKERGLRPNVIKIDVEGAELDVLRGGVETLRAAQPRIRMAFHPKAFANVSNASREICDLLSTAGYRIPDLDPCGFELREYDFTPREVP